MKEEELPEKNERGVPRENFAGCTVIVLNRQTCGLHSFWVRKRNSNILPKHIIERVKKKKKGKNKIWDMRMCFE